MVTVGHRPERETVLGVRDPKAQDLASRVPTLQSLDINEITVFLSLIGYTKDNVFLKTLKSSPGGQALYHEWDGHKSTEVWTTDPSQFRKNFKVICDMYEANPEHAAMPILLITDGNGNAIAHLTGYVKDGRGLDEIRKRAETTRIPLLRAYRMRAYEESLVKAKEAVSEYGSKGIAHGDAYEDNALIVKIRNAPKRRRHRTAILIDPLAQSKIAGAMADMVSLEEDLRRTRREGAMANA